MPKFLVQIRSIEKYDIEVEADNWSEASTAAWDKFDTLTSGERAECHNESDGEDEVLEQLSD